MISLDGLRPDAITSGYAPTLHKLALSGATTFKAQTVQPSVTLPAHTSMVTGLVPQHHGVTWNDDTTPTSVQVSLTTIFDVAARVGFTSALFVGKSKLSPLAHQGSPTYASIPTRGDLWWADTVGAKVVTYLSRESKPNLMFIHLPDIDVVGHQHGWMSDEYLNAVRHADSVVANIWQALKLAFGSKLTLIVTADHGGFGYGHASGSPFDTAIPWIAWGNGVTAMTLFTSVRTIDTGPTVLWLLGVSSPADWDGVPVKSAFPTLAP